MWPSGDGYRFAVQAGHSLVEPRPALVEIRLREDWPRRLAGVSVPEARVSVDAPGQRANARDGALVFTHDGISGPAALDVSGDVAERLAGRAEVALRVELLPKTPGGFWRGELQRWRRERGRSMVRTLLAERLPGALAAELVKLACGAPDARISTLAAGAARALERILAGVTLHAVGTGGFDRAMVTRGGVSLGEVDPMTLESRLARGLFFAGEVLDVDGPCGGFNLLWAFSSGSLAGSSAAECALFSARPARRTRGACRNLFRHLRPGLP